MKTSIKYLLLILITFALNGCGIYSFSGTSISPEVESITVYPFENKAQMINPSLSNTLTTEMQDKYLRLTKLELTDDLGHLMVEGTITSYEITPTSVTSDEVAAQNRLTITVKVKFTNQITPEEDFDKNFVAFADYDSTLSLDQVEANLIDEIVEILVEDIFNATVANW